MQLKKILILRFSSIGDIVLTTPIIRCAKIQLNGKKISIKRNFSINNLISRIILLESIRYVDRVVAFDSDEHLETLIKNMRPAIMVIGEEYRGKKIIGSEYVGEIVYFPKMEGFSSTHIINKLYDK